MNSNHEENETDRQGDDASEVGRPMTVRAVEELLGAFTLLAFRGTGNQPWVAPFRHDPIAFLLDTVSDATNLWAADARELLYQNRAATALAVGRCDDTVAEEFAVGDRHFERRCLRFGAGGRDYILEIIHQFPQQSVPPQSPPDHPPERGGERRGDD